MSGMCCHCSVSYHEDATRNAKKERSGRAPQPPSTLLATRVVTRLSSVQPAASAASLCELARGPDVLCFQRHPSFAVSPAGRTLARAVSSSQLHPATVDRRRTERAESSYRGPASHTPACNSIGVCQPFLASGCNHRCLTRHTSRQVNATVLLYFHRPAARR